VQTAVHLFFANMFANEFMLRLRRKSCSIAKKKLMKCLQKLLFFLLFIIAPSVCLAGPFGFNYGESRKHVIAEVGASNVLKNDTYSIAVSTAPKPHPNFEEYVLFFSPTQGLLKIIAIGKDVETNSAGEQLQESFHKTELSLSEIYGTPKTLDYLAEGSIWNEPRDWMMGLVKQDRNLVSMWDTSEKVHSEHISAVILEAIALSRETGCLRLIYEFDGWGQMSDEIRRQQDKVF
jgi:hypothetical protein